MTDMPLNEYDRDGDPTRYEAEDRERFRIQNDEQAAWAVRKLGQFRARQDEAKQVAANEQERISEWLDRQLSRDADDIAYFTALLTQYALSERDQSNRKSIDTPYGVVKTRAGQPKFVVDDHDAFLEYAKQSHPEWIRVREDADVTALKKAVTVDDTPTLGLVAVTEDGEIVPGLQITPAQVSVTVEEAK